LTHNPKTLGLALAAIFTMGTVVAPAAQAQQGTLTSTGPVTLIGTQTGEFGSGQNALTNFAVEKTECPEAVYTGHKYNVTPHSLVPNAVSTITVTPHYGLCKVSIPTTVDMNGCDYVIHLPETTGGGDTYGIKTTIACPSGKHITWTVFANAAKHATFEPFCDYSLTESAAGYTGLHATDTTNGFIDISGTIKSIAVYKKSPTGSFLCPEGTSNSGALDVDITLEGRNEIGAKTGVGISHQ
jgi:hypothetical protein